MRNLQRRRAATRLERDSIYAALDAEANPMPARLQRAWQEGLDEVTVDDFPREKPLRPKRQPAEGRADRLRVLFEKVQRQVSLLTLRNVYDKARKMVKNDPDFRDIRTTPPTNAEVRE